MNANVINNNESILEPLIENAILNAVKWIEIRCRPQEPDYMLALSTQFIKEFFNILVAVFLAMISQFLVYIAIKNR